VDVFVVDLAPSKATTTTVTSSSRRPVGGTPGKSQSIRTVCVQKMNSSTMRSWPTVREMGTSSTSAGMPGMKYWP
jgi:hypothetical protein